MIPQFLVLYNEYFILCGDCKELTMKNCFYCEKATVSSLLLLTVALFLVTLSNTGGTVSIEKTGEVYDYQDNSDGSFEYYSYMNNIQCYCYCKYIC